MNRRTIASLSASFATTLLLGAGCVLESAFGGELAQELRTVPYQILFESYQDQNWDLHLIHADGLDRM